MFDWNDIRILLAVAGEGSTLAASKKLDINQTTVSRRIQALEQALGLTLFERDTRGYSLTAQGRAMIDVAGEMGVVAENVLLRADYLRRASEGRIRVTAAHSSMTHWVLPLISEFRKHNPDIYFETNAAERYVSLENGDADVAIRAADRIEGDTLIARKLPPVKWGVYCSKSYLAANGMPRSLEELNGHAVLSYPRAMVEGVTLLKWLDQHVDSARIVSTVDSIVTMSASLRTENAVGVLPCVEGNPLPDLVMCFTQEELTSGLWLVASKEAYQEPRVRKFMKFVSEHFPKDGAEARF
jgi:DNA-binding transcriptional LysR family regulator